MSDPFWKSLPPPRNGYAPWLRDHGSLTLRIQRRCTKFVVRNKQSCLATAAHDETRLLGLPPQQKVYTREVFLHADELTVVFAHSVTAPQHLRGAWHTLQNLSSRPLGAMLFAHPQVHRTPLHYQALRPNHPLHRRASCSLDAPPPVLWARRSLFILDGAPLLVTEVFLPDILKLPK